MSRNRLRLASNLAARAGVYAMAAIALVPLSLVLAYTVSRGWPAAHTAEFYLNAERPVGIPGGGVSAALVGTLEMVAMASLLAIPIGVVAGLHLVEYRALPAARWIRLAADVLVGMPSIAVGLFAYALLVAPFHRFSAISASVALAILMLPVVTRTAEGAIALVPDGIREAGLALGLPRWKVAVRLILPAAIPGVTTGCLLAVARAAGETAPLLFTAFGNRFFTADATHSMSSLTLIVYHDALTPYTQLQEQAWGAALVLVLLVLVVNLASRYALRRQLRMAGQA